MRIVITGGTGFVGTHLVEQCMARGYGVTLLVRNLSSAQRRFPPAFFPSLQLVAYTPLQLGAWQECLNGADALVNLAGATIAGRRWTDKVKREIVSSRVDTTKVLVQAIAHLSQPPKVLVSASAIGYYGTDPDKTFDEYSFAGKGFLAQVCQDWEAAADGAVGLTRVIKLRIGIVLGYGGALAKILPIFQAGAGGTIASGQQWFSWIHRTDLVRLILWSITRSELVGVVNGTAPHPVTNRELTSALASVLKCPAFLPVPAIALQVLFGEASELLLKGQRVVPQKALLNGFNFDYPEITGALSQILNA
jgi:uncharacterized protein (TIGR01777 family)